RRRSFSGVHKRLRRKNNFLNAVTSCRRDVDHPRINRLHLFRVDAGDVLRRGFSLRTPTSPVNVSPRGNADLFLSLGFRMRSRPFRRSSRFSHESLLSLLLAGGSASTARHSRIGHSRRCSTPPPIAQGHSPSPAPSW